MTDLAPCRHGWTDCILCYPQTIKPRVIHREAIIADIKRVVLDAYPDRGEKLIGELLYRLRGRCPVCTSALVRNEDGICRKCWKRFVHKKAKQKNKELKQKKEQKIYDDIFGDDPEEGPTPFDGKDMEEVVPMDSEEE